MPGQFAIRAKGVVRDYFPPSTFLVELGNGHRLFARVPYKQRDKVPDIKSGDKVSIEISPTDFSNGVLVLDKE